MYIKECVTLGIENPVIEDPSLEVKESLISDLKIKEVRAIYPLIRAINSGRLTRNYTFYPAESIIGKNKLDNPTGYSSFVKPYGKPILREHQAQNVPGLIGNIEQADVPMGRIVYAGFRRRIEKKDGPANLPSKKHIPGTVEGDGAMYVVPAITDPEAITRVLGGAYHTVSIGSQVENVWEAISGKNIAEIRRKGEELPPYERGQLYEGKLSYWRMGEIKGVEASFVNVPSDEYAGVIDPDIGQEGIRLLVAEKKSGKSNEFSFFDAKTAEKVLIDMDEFAWDTSFFMDSAPVGKNIWWLNKETATFTEAASMEYHCPKCDYESDEPGECPDCGEKLVKDKEDDEEENSSTKPEEKSSSETKKNEDTEMAKEINFKEATVAEIVEAYTEEMKPSLLETFTTETSVTDLVEGNGERIENADLFAEISDFATKVCGDWDENAAKFALSLYLDKGGTIKAPLVENDSSKNEFEGFIVDNNTTTLVPLYVTVGENIVPIVKIVNQEQLKLFIEELPVISEKYKLWPENSEESLSTWKEKLEKLSTVFEESLDKIEAPCQELNIENLTNFILSNEFSVTDNTNRSDLAALVGVARRHKLSKQELTEASTAYSVFGTSVLRKLLDDVPAEPAAKEESNEQTESKSVEPAVENPVEVFPDPVAATEKTDGNNKKSEESVWLGVTTVKSSKHSGKTLKNSAKEKR